MKESEAALAWFGVLLLVALIGGGVLLFMYVVGGIAATVLGFR